MTKVDNNSDLPKAYNPKEVEHDIYQQWENSGFFNPDNLPSKREESFTISLPPPNATGSLHAGHAVMLALEDMFIRHARMNGKDALWLPGTDHAAIATESVVIKKLQKKGMRDPRAELGREKLVEQIANFVEESRSNINNQVRAMGSSCDWSREAYTLEPTLNRAVNEVFKKMYNDGLIYRGARIINWDPKLQTTISDDEIEWQEEKIPFYYFQYGPFVIGTSRPETKFGDKYVVMHPDDDRYKQYNHGDTFECEWINGKITATVIKDNVIDKEFGSGVMTITPWHDRTDFEIAERHNLDKEQIIDYNGRMLDVAGEEFKGLKIKEAREKIVEKLKEKGLLVSIEEEYVHNIAISYRSKGPIEPQIKEQWFIDVNKEAVEWKKKKMSLKQIMQDVVHSGDIQIVPEHFNKTYFHWIYNLRDWCISRVIWWGHRVPVWYKDKEIHVDSKKPTGPDWSQDPDTLDTWFSSALWTWSTLIDKELIKDEKLNLEDLLKRSPDFQRFHPTSIMETGYDILFFWVARMILMTTYATGQIPFKYVYLHGLIRDKRGQKMSKSHPETMIDPLEVIEESGTDALRLSMIIGQSPGNDQKLSKEKIAGYKKFINKIWNISRYILMNLEGDVKATELKPQTLSDRWILSRFNQIIKETNGHIEKFRLSQAVEGLYEFTWHELADWYLEIAKHEGQKQNILIHVLSNTLKLFHPFIPFITEHIWSQLKIDKEMLIVQPWPQLDEKLIDEDIEKEFTELQEVITKIRNWKAENKIPFKESKDIKLDKVFSEDKNNLIEHLTNVKLTDTGTII